MCDSCANSTIPVEKKSDAFDVLDSWTRERIAEAQAAYIESLFPSERLEHRGALDVLWKLRTELLGCEPPTEREWHAASFFVDDFATAA